MTEAEWLACENPEAKLVYGRDRCGLTREAVDRKFRLFTIACAREEWERAQSSGEYFHLGERVEDDRREHYVHPEYGYEKAILYAEDRADGVPCKVTRMCQILWILAMFFKGEDLAFAALGYDPDGLSQIPPEQITETILSYHVHPSRYIREVFGNPFRPITFSPSWRTSTAVTLAKQMYESRDFGAMPILADALQDAGCDCADVLDHCRGPGPHVRGCWVLDRVLGKE